MYHNYFTCRTMATGVTLRVNTSERLILYYTPLYIVNPIVHTKFDLVIIYTLLHELTSGGEGQGKWWIPNTDKIDFTCRTDRPTHC